MAGDRVGCSFEIDKAGVEGAALSACLGDEGVQGEDVVVGRGGRGVKLSPLNWTMDVRDERAEVGRSCDRGRAGTRKCERGAPLLEWRKEGRGNVQVDVCSRIQGGGDVKRRKSKEALN